MEAMDFNWRYTLTALGDMFLPRVCVVCGRHLTPHEQCACLPCLSDLPLTRFWEVEHHPMADRYNSLLTPSPEEPYGYAVALFYYNSESPYRHITPALKYRDHRSAGRYFARMLAARVAGCPWLRDADLAVPVPLHPLRRLHRGYNQAGIIARAVGEALGIPTEERLLRRVRYSTSQTRTSVADKRRNVSGAFRARSGGCEPRHILLIDDVLTTGATLASCHDALRELYPSSTRISVLTLAFVSPV